MKADNLPELRKQLSDLLEGGNAHADFDKALLELPPNLRGRRPAGAPHSLWELLEHMRIAQWDILAFMRDPKHVSPKFPSGYWPASPSPSEGQWEKSIEGFQTDHAALLEMIADPDVDLLKPMPQMEGQPILQKILLVADHNAYHLGQLILVRRLVGAWS